VPLGFASCQSADRFSAAVIAPDSNSAATVEVTEKGRPMTLAIKVSNNEWNLAFFTRSVEFETDHKQSTDFGM
jgi:hypothetical protein